jgi:hypothetical protein
MGTFCPFCEIIRGWIVRPQGDASSWGRNVLGTLCPGDALSWGRFVRGRFVRGRIVRGRIVRVHVRYRYTACHIIREYRYYNFFPLTKMHLLQLWKPYLLRKWAISIISIVTCYCFSRVWAGIVSAKANLRKPCHNIPVIMKCCTCSSFMQSCKKKLALRAPKREAAKVLLSHTRNRNLMRLRHQQKQLQYILNIYINFKSFKRSGEKIL